MTRLCSICGDMGDVRGESGVKIVSVRRLGLESVCERCGRDAVEANPLTTGQLDAIREMKARDLKRRRARDRYRAMRDLGMVKTPYGWE